jgi:hypothetical protein
LLGDSGRLRRFIAESPMRSFAGAFPELAFDLSLELRATGRADLARELEACTVKAVSYEPETDIGLVALEPSRQLNAVERNVVGQKLGQVISFSDAPYASLQLDNFGRVVAVELVAPPRNLRWLLRPAANYRWKGP